MQWNYERALLRTPRWDNLRSCSPLHKNEPQRLFKRPYRLSELSALYVVVISSPFLFVQWSAFFFFFLALAVDEITVCAVWTRSEGSFVRRPWTYEGFFHFFRLDLCPFSHRLISLTEQIWGNKMHRISDTCISVKPSFLQPLEWQMTDVVIKSISYQMKRC